MVFIYKSNITLWEIISKISTVSYQSNDVILKFMNNYSIFLNRLIHIKNII
jgi:hypothetical protein